MRTCQEKDWPHLKWGKVICDDLPERFSPGLHLHQVNLNYALQFNWSSPDLPHGLSPLDGDRLEKGVAEDSVRLGGPVEVADTPVEGALIGYPRRECCLADPFNHGRERLPGEPLHKPRPA